MRRLVRVCCQRGKREMDDAFFVLRGHASFLRTDMRTAEINAVEQRGGKGQLYRWLFGWSFLVSCTCGVFWRAVLVGCVASTSARRLAVTWMAVRLLWVKGSTGFWTIVGQYFV